MYFLKDSSIFNKSQRRQKYLKYSGSYSLSLSSLTLSSVKLSRAMPPIMELNEPSRTMEIAYNRTHKFMYRVHVCIGINIISNKLGTTFITNTDFHP